MPAPDATTPVAGPRLTRWAVAVGFALVLAFVVTVIQADGSSTSTGRLGGDYPAFYAAGRIAASGDYDELYDPERTHAEQVRRDLLGGEDGFLAYWNPPHVALVYRPLSALPYRMSYAVHTVVMGAALVAAFVLMRSRLAVVRANLVVAVVAALTFAPMLRAVVGAQNTALSLLLMVGAWAALARGRDAGAGIALGLLLYKPQLAVPLAALFLLRGRWRILAGFVPVAAGLWVVNAVVAGPGWMTTWLDGVSRWSELEAEFNADNTISFPGVAETLFGRGDFVSLVVGWSLAAAVGLIVSALWWRWPRSGDVDLSLPMAVAAAGLLLVSPHAMYYEAGLLVLTGAVVADRGGRADRRWLAALWLAGWLHPLNGLIGVTPVLGIAVAALTVSGVVARRRLERPASASMLTP